MSCSSQATKLPFTLSDASALELGASLTGRRGNAGSITRLTANANDCVIVGVVKDPLFQADLGQLLTRATLPPLRT